MSNISMVEARLPPGFRFHPKDEELVCDYLMKKVNNCDSLLMIEVDLNKCEPWDLPEMARVGDKDWYFYSQRDRKYATGSRTNRATVSGYWKATGKDRAVVHKGSLVGMRKTLVFYEGRAPKGKKSDWVMHEFRLEGPLFPPNSLKEDWVLCRVFNKSKLESSLGKGNMMMGSCFDDTGSSSLPALMDSYITFDQTQPNLLDDEYEQVPCFSMFSDHNNQPVIDQILSHTNVYSSSSGPNPSLPHLPIMKSSTSAGADLYSCDNKDIKAVLDHIMKMENNTSMVGSPSLGEGSSESYLSEVGIPSSLWNQC